MLRTIENNKYFLFFSYPFCRKMAVATRLTVAVVAALISGGHCKPQHFGDNFLSGNFENPLADEAAFGDPDFMPEFNFDNFFQKIDAPEAEDYPQRRRSSRRGKKSQ